MTDKSIFKYPDFRVTLLPSRSPDGLFWFLVDRAFDKTPGKISSDTLLGWIETTMMEDGNFKWNIPHALIDKKNVIVYDLPKKKLWYRTNAEHVLDIWPSHSANYMPAFNYADGLFRNTNVFHDNTYQRIGIGTDGPSGILSLDGSAGQTFQVESNPTEDSEGSELAIKAGGSTIAMVKTVVVNNGGTGYLPGDNLYLTRPGGGSNCKLDVITIAATGGLSVLTIADGGADFSDGSHILTVVQGGASGGSIKVTASGGVITSITQIILIGTGYSVANNLVTTGGDGTGCLVNLTQINGAILTVSITTQGSRYSTGVISTSTNSAWGSNCKIEVTAVENSMDKIGGNLKLYSGLSTGTGTSEIQFYTVPEGSSGRDINYALKRAVISTEGYFGLNIEDPISYLDVEGSHGRSIETKTDLAIDLDESYSTILLDGTSNNVTVTLPDATLCIRRVYTIVAIDITNTVKFISAGGDINEIAGATGITFEDQFQSYTVQSDGVQWWVIANSLPHGCYWKRDITDEFLYPRFAYDYVYIPTYLIVGDETYSWWADTKISIQDSSDISYQGLGIYMETLSHTVIQNTFYGINLLMDSGGSTDQINEITGHKTILENTNTALTTMMRGHYMEINADAEVTSVFGIDYAFDLANTVTDFFGVRIQTISGGGIITNKTALYIGDYSEASEGVTTAWSIYANGGNSYFKDFVGIGLTPTTHEDVLSTLDVEGSLGSSIETSAATLDLDYTHFTVLANAASNSIIAWLPDAELNARRRHRVKAIAIGTGYSVRVKSKGGDIDDVSAATGILLEEFEAVEFHSDGTQWWRTSSYEGDHVFAFKTIYKVVEPAVWPDPQPLYDDVSIVADSYKDVLWLKEGDGIEILLDADHDVVKFSLIDEYVEDLIGAMLTDTHSIDFTYDDANSIIKADLIHQNSHNITHTVPDVSGLHSIIAISGQTSQDLMYFNGTYWTRFPKSTVNGYILSTNGSGNLEWIATSSGYTDSDAREAVGLYVDDSYNIDFTYNTLPGDQHLTAIIKVSGETSNDLLFFNPSASPSPAWDRFAANSSATVKYLSSVSGVLSWVTVSLSDTYGYWTAKDDSAVTKNISSNELLFFDGTNGIVTALSGATTPYTLSIGHSTTGGTSISSDNSNGTVIQDLTVTIDSWGHVTTTSIGTIDLDTRYYTETESDSRFLSFRTIQVVADSVSFTWGSSDVVADLYNDVLKLVSTNSNLTIETDATNDAIRFTVNVGDHNLLDGNIHPDTTTTSAVAGSIIYANSSNLWTALAKDTDGKYLKLVSGLPSWETIPTGVNTTYDISAVSTTGGAFLRLTGSDLVTDDVKFASGTQITAAYTDASTITISTNFTGTKDYVVRYSNNTPTMILGNSVIRDDGSTVGILTSPNSLYAVDVAWAASTNTSAAMRITHSGNTVSYNSYGIYLSRTGTGANNCGLYITASGATNNYAVYGTSSGSGTGNYATYFVVSGTAGSNIGVTGIANSTAGTSYGGSFSAEGTSSGINIGIGISATGGTTNYGIYSTNGLTYIAEIPAYSTSASTTKVLVSISEVVKYRTAAQIVTDGGGIIGNQTITLSGDVSGSGTTSIAVTVTGIRSKSIPTLSTGYLRYTGSVWEFLNESYSVVGHTHPYQPLDADLTAIAALTGTYGLLKKTAENTWIIDTATYLTSVTAHKLLSSTHSDTVAADAVLGDLLYGNSTPEWTKLAGNITTTKKFLTQTGTGSISAVPGWNTISATDLPTHSITTYHSASNWKIFASNGSGTIVEISNVAIGSYLASGGTASLPTWTTFPTSLPPGAHALNTHSDVTISAIASGEILKWNGSVWINNTLVEAGIIPSSGVAVSNGTAWVTSYSTTGTGSTVILSTYPTIAGAYLSNHTRLNDNIYLRFGTDSDYYAYSNGTNWYLYSSSGKAGIIYNSSEEVELYKGGALKLETTTNGVNVYYSLSCYDSAGGTLGFFVGSNSTDAYMDLKESATPTTPTDGWSRLWVNSSGNYSYKKNGSSTVYTLSTTTGTVTSIAMTVPTGLTVSGSPITSSGTLAVSLQSGYSIPTTANQSNWSTAYGWGNHASAGYVVGPSSATDNAIARFDTTTGKLIQNSVVIVDDSGNISTSGYFLQGSYTKLYTSSNICRVEINRTYVYSVRISNTAGVESATFDPGGQVILYYNGASKLETVSGGVNITGTLTATADVVAYSDATLKYNVYDVTEALSKTLSLRPVYYTSILDQHESLGFIAQEVKDVEPKLVRYDGSYYGLAYGKITALCVGAIQEHNALIERLEKRIAELEKQLNS